MILRSTLGLLLLSSACGGTPVSSFVYGKGQPGANYPEGGEIRFEHVNLFGMPQTWVMAYQYNGPKLADNAPFATPADNGTGTYGNCVDERASATWPFTPITNANYLDMAKVQLSGPGITGSLDIIKTNPPNMVGNSTFRMYDFTYGGGAPGDPNGFNASHTTPDTSTPDSDYTLDIGDGHPMSMHMPAAYETPLGIGTSSTPVAIARHQDLDLTWTPPANDFGPSGHDHARDTHFNITLFADPQAANKAQWLCLPDSDGHTVVPAAVIDTLPAGGLLVNADLSHYMELRDAGGEMRRFDLVTIYCNISTFSTQ